MTNKEYLDWVLSMEKPFSDYCIKIRGYSLVPAGVFAVKLWFEFMDFGNAHMCETIEDIDRIILEEIAKDQDAQKKEASND